MVFAQVVEGFKGGRENLLIKTHTIVSVFQLGESFITTKDIRDTTCHREVLNKQYVLTLTKTVYREVKREGSQGLFGCKMGDEDNKTDKI